MCLLKNNLPFLSGNCNPSTSLSVTDSVMPSGVEV